MFMSGVLIGLKNIVVPAKPTPPGRHPVRAGFYEVVAVPTTPTTAGLHPATTAPQVTVAAS